MEERRNFIDDRNRRYSSTDENRCGGGGGGGGRYDDRKEEGSKRNEKEKEKIMMDVEKNRTENNNNNNNQCEKSMDHQANELHRITTTAESNRINNRLLPNISSQMINIDNIRRIKNHVLNRHDGDVDNNKSYADNITTKKCNNVLLNSNSNYNAGTGSGNGVSGTITRGNRCRPNSRSTTPVTLAATSVNDAK